MIQSLMNGRMLSRAEDSSHHLFAAGGRSTHVSFQAKGLHDDLPKCLHILSRGCCLIDRFIRFPANCECQSVGSSRSAKSH